jgi:hypothetical protein
MQDWVVVGRGQADRGDCHEDSAEHHQKHKPIADPVQ